MNNFDTRRAAIIELAAGPENEPQTIAYTTEENGVWQKISAALEPAWQDRVIPELTTARDSLGLSQEKIPQLSEISQRLHARTGFEFRAVGGLAERNTFFGSLAAGKFLSTQFIRDSKNPFYTEEPDIVHEVLGHATLLANPDLAELHRLAGSALVRVESKQAKQFIANVWWFSGEFGVIKSPSTVRAFGAGLLSSVAELGSLNHAKIEPLNITRMGTVPYCTDTLQPVLFGAKSLPHAIECIGGFFETTCDEKIEQLRGAASC